MKQHENIQRFIDGDETVDSLNLLCRYCDGDPLYDTTPLSRLFFQAFKGSSKKSLASLNVAIAGGVDDELTELFAEALAHTKFQDINTLEIEFIVSSQDKACLILEALEKSKISVKDLRIGFDVTCKNAITHLSNYLVSTKSTLKHLHIHSVYCTSQHHVNVFGSALQQLEKISTLRLRSLYDDPTYQYSLQLHLMISDMKNIEHLQLDPPVQAMKNHKLLADCVFQIQLPKLTNLKHLEVDASFEPGDGMDDFCENLNAAVVAHPSIASLIMNWRYSSLVALKSMVPAFQKVKSLALNLCFWPDDGDDYDGIEDHPLRPLELETFWYILRQCSHLQTLHLDASGLIHNDDELILCKNILCGYSHLESLSLYTYDWDDRDGMDDQNEEPPFPTLVEKETLLDLARSLPHLTTFKITDGMAKCYELSKQLAQNTMKYHDMVEDRIPLEEWPRIIALLNQANGVDDILKLEILYELLQNKHCILLTEWHSAYARRAHA